MLIHGWLKTEYKTLTQPHAEYFSYISTKTCSILIKTAKFKNENKFKKSTVETLLNELFSLGDKENEIKMIEYANELGIEISN